MSEMTEREELNGLIERSKAGIAQHLINMGVQPDAAQRAVEYQVKFGRAPNGSLLMKRGAWMASPVSFQRECAEHILPTIPPEQRQDFSTDDGQDQMWSAAEKRLQNASGSHSRAELLAEKNEQQIAKERGDAGDLNAKPYSIEELAIRKRQINPIY